MAREHLENRRLCETLNFECNGLSYSASIALQHGVPLETIRRALLRDSHGRASSPLGVALDLLAGEGTR
jgi:hypothetical protein